MTAAPLVFVIDDDPSVRSSLKFLLSTVGLQAETFDSADSFLHKKPSYVPCCLVLDVRLPGLSGTRFPTRACGEEYQYPDNLSHRARRHSDERSCDESRGGRVSYQTIP